MIDFEGIDLEFVELPIEPLHNDVPLRPQESWKEKKNPSRLVKTFEFFDEVQRNKFVFLLFDLEELMQHRAQITLASTGRHIRITICTPEAGVLTELDREFALEADNLYNESFDGYDSVYEEEISNDIY